MQERKKEREKEQEKEGVNDMWMQGSGLKLQGGGTQSASGA